MVKHILRSFSENLFKKIFGFNLSSILRSYLKFQRQKSVCTHVITVDHNPSKNCKLTLWMHPFVVKNIFDVLFKDVVHFVNKGGLIILSSVNLFSMRSQKMLNAIHLVIKISTLKISCISIS